MTALTPLEAYDVISYSAQLQDRLSAALAVLAKKQGLKREKEWLSGAVELLHSSREGMTELVERSLRLPELTAVREEHAVELQGRWVDGLEKLLAGITFHAGSRAPLIETLFPKQKLPTLRRAKREVIAAYEAEWEKRLVSGYVKRMLGQETFAFALPVIDEVRAAFLPWKAAFSSEGLPEDQALAVRAELATAANKLEAPIRQAKLIAEASLAPVSGAFDASGIGLKPRKHPAKVVAAAPPAADKPEAEAGADEPTEPSGKPMRKAAGPGKKAKRLASSSGPTAKSAADKRAGGAGEAEPTASGSNAGGTPEKSPAKDPGADAPAAQAGKPSRKARAKQPAAAPVGTA